MSWNSTLISLLCLAELFHPDKSPRAPRNILISSAKLQLGTNEITFNRLQLHLYWSNSHKNHNCKKAITCVDSKHSDSLSDGTVIT
jgi:hypothetical protein